MTKINQLYIEGMTCAHCAKGIEEHLSNHGLSEVRVDLASKSAFFAPTTENNISDLIQGLAKIGYKARTSRKDTTTLSHLDFITILCTLLAAPMVLAKFFHSEFFHQPLVQLVLTVPIMLTGGIYFSRSALASLKLKKPNMDVLIALGAWAAFFYSLTGWFLNLGPKYLFFETSASIIAIVLLGNLIEAKALSKTEKSLRELQSLQPDKIKRKLANSTEIITADQLREGDYIILVPGDRAPCDAIITQGSAELDTSLITGESIPLFTSASNEVISGSLIVGGQIEAQATKVGHDTSLAKIIRTIQNSRAAKPELEKLADRLTNYFVPVVLAISIFTLIINLLVGIELSDSILRSIAVLVISCPCALGIATPTAVTVALGIASRMGVLVAKARIFEVFPQISKISFDKTGTLTDGRFEIESLENVNYDLDQAKAIIASLERYSHHPIAVALRKYCGNNYIDLEQVNEQRGIGIFAKDRAGNEYELSSKDIPDSFHLALRANQKIIALIKLSDKLRSEAAEVVGFFRNTGLQLQILSGDSANKVKYVAEKLNISDTKSGLQPAQKLKLIEDQAHNQKIAFVGDGINDSAALARAHLGITFGNASDLAKSSADVTIISGGLEKIRDLYLLSKRTTASIKQNLFWAFFYNIIFIPVAAMGMLSPTHAAFAMIMSDLIVVANSLRLRLWKPKK